MYFILHWVSFIGSSEAPRKGSVHTDPNADSISLFFSVSTPPPTVKANWSVGQVELLDHLSSHCSPTPVPRSKHFTTLCLSCGTHLDLLHNHHISPSDSQHSNRIDVDAAWVSVISQCHITQASIVVFTHHFFSSWLVR